MKTIAIVQARLGSTRFPRKVLERIEGRPMIAHVVERVAAIGSDVHVIVACPPDDRQAILAAVREAQCDQRHVYAPDVRAEDVLGRFAAVAKNYPADAYMRVTADCPLLAPDLAQAVLTLYRCQPKYVEVPAPYYLDGFDVEVFSRELLERAEREATDPYDREHVAPWIQRACGVYKEQFSPPCPRYKLSVDTQEDLDRVRRIMAKVKGLNFADTLAAAAECGL